MLKVECGFCFGVWGCCFLVRVSVLLVQGSKTTRNPFEAQAFYGTSRLSFLDRTSDQPEFQARKHDRLSMIGLQARHAIHNYDLLGRLCL